MPLEAPAIPKRLEDMVPILQDIRADIKRLADSFLEAKDSFMRVKEYHKVFGVTEGDVAVGAAVRFPDSGQTEGWRDFIRAGKVTEVMIANTGQNPLYLAYDRDATTGSPFVIPAGTGVTFHIQIQTFISLCSTSAAVATTARVAIMGE